MQSCIIFFHFLPVWKSRQVLQRMHGNARWASSKLVTPMYMKGEGYVLLDDKLKKKSTYIKGLIH